MAAGGPAGAPSLELRRSLAAAGGGEALDDALLSGDSHEAAVDALQDLCGIEDFIAGCGLDWPRPGRPA
eukprot:6916736-Prymnesium_polylepis.1